MGSYKRRGKPSGRPIRVGINAAIRARGISGTARVVDLLSAGLAGEPDLETFTVQPRWRGRGNKLLNAARDCYWDMWRASQTQPAPDVFLSPCNVGVTASSIPHLLWIQDTVVLDHPGLHDPSYAAYARLFFDVSAKRCSRIVTGSQDAADRIRQRWPTAPQITVLPWPAPRSPAEQPRTSAKPPYAALMVAATEAHKNHLAAIDAVRMARLLSGEDIRLTVVGPPGRTESSVQEWVRAADPQGRWVDRRGPVSEEELQELYAKSWVLIQPAFDEGFGLPLLEAATQALPVLHSGRGGMSEVVPSPVRSVAGEAFCGELLRLLDQDEYTDASRTALDAAHTHSFERFQDGLRRLVRESLD